MKRLIAFLLALAPFVSYAQWQVYSPTEIFAPLYVQDTSRFDGTSIFMDNVGIGTTSPYSKLTVTALDSTFYASSSSDSTFAMIGLVDDWGFGALNPSLTGFGFNDPRPGFFSRMGWVDISAAGQEKYWFLGYFNPTKAISDGLSIRGRQLSIGMYDTTGQFQYGFTSYKDTLGIPVAHTDMFEFRKGINGGLGLDIQSLCFYNGYNYWQFYTDTTGTGNSLRSNIISMRDTAIYFGTSYGENRTIIDEAMTIDSSRVVTIYKAFKYPDGTQSNGYVLTSDASGNASWQPNGASSFESVAASNGDTTNATEGVRTTKLSPAGVIASHTVNTPPNPVNGQLWSITTNGNTITALTIGTSAVNGIIGALTTLTTTGATYVYDAAGDQWSRVD